MRKATRWFGLSLLSIAFLGAIVVAQEANSGSNAKGVWKLDTAKSDFGQAPKPKSMRLVVTEDTPTALKWHITGTAADGTAIHESFSGAVDGKSYPLPGDPTASSVAYTRNGDEVDGTMTMKDGSTMKSTITMSNDNKTMTVQSGGNGPNGPMKITEVWNRVSAAPGTHKSPRKKPAQ